MRFTEPCHCGASDCVRCRGFGADRECRCEDECECEPCGECDECEAERECPRETRCRCRDGCECAGDEDDGSDDAYDRARMLEWMFWEQYSHEPYVAVARFQVKYLGKSVDTLEPRLVERGAAALQRMEQALAGSPFLVGDRARLADVALVAYTRVCHEGGFNLDVYPAVKAWVGRVEQALKIA